MVDSSEFSFQCAAEGAMKDVFENGAWHIIEPVMKVEVRLGQLKLNHYSIILLSIFLSINLSVFPYQSLSINLYLSTINIIFPSCNLPVYQSSCLPIFLSSSFCLLSSFCLIHLSTSPSLTSITMKMLYHRRLLQIRSTYLLNTLPWCKTAYRNEAP